MKDFSFPSRRSVVMSTGGMVASSQPLAVQAGVGILTQGGNAIDAAIATAAALNVVEPMSTGIGGDAFALVYLAKEKKLEGLNAGGPAPATATVEKMKELGYEKMPETGMLSVTLPGAFDGWCALLERYGSMSLSQVLAPAIELAEKGFPVIKVIGYTWKKNESKLRNGINTADTYLVNGMTPEQGEIFRQLQLAQTLRRLAEGGRDEFYKGDIARAIANCSCENGGLITFEDLSQYRCEWVKPIKTNYRGYDVYECPPNGQGLVTLMALNILEGYDLGRLGQNSVEYLHLLIEALKLAFADAWHYISDPAFADIPLEGLLSKNYADSRRRLINENRAMKSAYAGTPASDTVYLAVTDRYGNSVSFINSLFHAFGAGVVVKDTGICLQNRGSTFSLDEMHVNCIAPRKRPYHTIIPSMVFKDGKLFLTFGVMGGLMQPQGQVQVLLNMVDLGMDVQTALDAPRFRYIEGNECIFEPGISRDVVRKLEGMGHRVVEIDDPYRQEFGGGQAIMVHPESKALIGGSDPRKDGCAMGIW